MEGLGILRKLGSAGSSHGRAESKGLQYNGGANIMVRKEGWEDQILDPPNLNLGNGLNETNLGSNCSKS